MPAVVVDPAHVHAFKDEAALERWYKANHDRAPELWLQLHKKGSGLPSVSNVEALDVALCWGWIDAIRKPLDDRSFLQRYTPRGRKSTWSTRNREHIERLRAAGRMTPQGEAQVAAAMADGRWERAYEGAAKMGMPEDLLAAIENDPAALATFQTLNAQNRYALAFRTHNMKTVAGREKKIESFVEMLKRGETPHPNGKGKAK